MKKIIAASLALFLLAGVLVTGSVLAGTEVTSAPGQQNRNENKNANNNSNNNADHNRSSNSNVNSNGGGKHKGRHRGRHRNSDDHN